MSKRILKKDVYNEAKERINYILDEFERVYISFSGGKDSTVMLHILMDEVINRNRKVGILFIDLEGQYKLTISHVEKCFDMYKENADIYWVCLPIHLRNAVSVYEPFWKCWDKNSKKSWVRDIPKDGISNVKYFPFFKDGMEFEEFVPLFGEWYSQGKNTACFVGIRADESLNRFRTISSKTKETYKNIQWTTKVTEHCFNIYPIYDWRTRDDWIYQAKNPKKPHNELYDLMYKAGLTIHQMRICQPYGDDQRRGLWLFHLIEPETWARIVARVNGANMGALYIQETGNINGYRRISKPPQHTWKSFAELLIKSTPKKTQEHWENKIILFNRWWEKRGYPNGIPDEAPYKLEAAKLVPSWRRVCKSLLRNDYWCKGLGFSQQKSSAYIKYLDLMRRRKKRWVVDLNKLIMGDEDGNKRIYENTGK